jgi:acetyl esterase/lipase
MFPRMIHLTTLTCENGSKMYNYLTLDMNIPTRRSRTTASISVKNVPISYEENKHFRVRIRDPVPDAGKEGCLRPALLMLHGGGWIHSFPEVDEGASI